MCGITGLFSNNAGAIDPRRVQRMTARLRHRGPDGGGLVLIAPGELTVIGADQELPAAGHSWMGGLGHRRLSIIDLETGFQPMSDPSRRYWIVYNGEIYNYRRLREVLERDGVSFLTTSDTEVLLHALILWGVGALDRLEGMFAFALWDDQEKSLLLARDRIGIKPLYYGATEGIIAFGSEIKALRECSEIELEIDRAALADYLTYRYIPGPRTIHEGIRSLPPANYLFVKPGESRSLPEPVCWWKLDTSTVRDLSLKTAGEELDELLEVVCRDHLISDVPVGVFLSGGVDSSAVLAHAQANSAEPLECVSVAFEGIGRSRYNESGAAARIAEHLGSRLTPISLDIELLSSLPQFVESLDEPLADPSVLPSLRMMEAARARSKVMLAGDGGDEIFGGYNRYRRMMDALAVEPERGLFGWIESWRRRPAEQPLSRYAASMAFIPPDELKALLRPEFAPEEEPIPLDRRYPVSGERDSLTQWQQLDVQSYLVDDNLKKADRSSMAFGVELRVPLLDRRIVEFGFALHHRLRLGDAHAKLVLRESLVRRLPPKVLVRKKRGFKVPIREWIRQEGPNPLLDPLLGEDEPVWSIVRRPVALRWIEHHRSGEINHEPRIWILAVLNAWLQARRPALSV